VTLDLAKNAKSEWIASMGLPAGNLTGLVVAGVEVDGNSVKFVGVELMMAKFDLTLGPEGEMKGTMAGAPGSLPVEFQRKGEAKVELIPPSPALSKALEGDWEGWLGPPNVGRLLAFHFKNQPDGTVAATIGSGDEMRLPLNDVKQTGQKVEFGIKIGHGSFEGTLNPEGTEIAGQLKHEERSTPLTLRKK